MNIAVWLRMFRMKGKTSAYARQMVSIPYVAIAVGWVMLWLLWPHGVKVVARQHVPAVTSVSLVRVTENPFSKPIPMHLWKAAGSGDDNVTVMPWMVTRPAKVLERSIFSADESAKGADSSGVANLKMSAYRPVWSDKAVFNIEAGRGMYLTMESSRTLTERGFEVPDLGPDLKKADKPWIVKAFVEVDEKGKVAGVFLESGCDYKEINSAVVRTLYRGLVSKAGARCEGLVKVNFGRN